MPKPRAGPLISPRNHKISRRLKKPPAEDQDPIALRDLSDAAVLLAVVGARPVAATMVVGPTIVVMAGAGDIGAGALVGGKPELLGGREAAPPGGRLRWRSRSFLFLDSNLNRPLHGSPNNQSVPAAQLSRGTPPNLPKSVTCTTRT